MEREKQFYLAQSTQPLIVCFILELCLTSNLIGQTVPDLDNHQFKFWYEKQHPCIICVSIALHLYTYNIKSK